MRRAIAIIAHPGDGFWGQPRLIHLLMKRWESMGLEPVLAADPERPSAADIALLHVSLSVVPEEYRRLSERYSRTLNAAVVDIRKRRFSRLLVDRADRWPGPVIVKSDRNAGGMREARSQPLSSRLAEAIRPWSSRQTLERYSVYPNLDSVPPGVWRNPNLVVERFLAERSVDRFLCRHWLFFGSKEVTRRTFSFDPMVKFRGAMERTSDLIPDELRRIREELGFDYGKFDYGIVDGEVVLYDVNRTPGAASDPRLHAHTVDVLAPGIEEYLA